jgi:transposase-like protein
MAASKSTEARLAQLRDRRWSQSDARVVLDALERSGEPVRMFARRHGLDAQRIYKWRTRLADESAVASERADEIEFAPVVVTGLGRASAPVIMRIGEIELEVVEPDRVDPAWLAQVLAAARRV